MGFTSFNLLVFFLAFPTAYWLIPSRQWKNALLIGNYIFYGWTWIWHLALIFLATLTDYLLGHDMTRWKSKSAYFESGASISTQKTNLYFRKFSPRN